MKAISTKITKSNGIIIKSQKFFLTKQMNTLLIVGENTLLLVAR